MYLARILLAACVALFFGGFYYSPACALPAWTRASELGGRDFKRVAFGQGHPPTVFGLAYVAAVVAAVALDQSLAQSRITDAAGAALHGAWLGLAFTSGGHAIQCSFGAWPWQLWLVDSVYHVVTLALCGAVLAALT